MKRWFTAHKGRFKRVGWAVAEGLIGVGIGLMAITLYLRGQGC